MLHQNELTFLNWLSSETWRFLVLHFHVGHIIVLVWKEKFSKSPFLSVCKHVPVSLETSFSGHWTQSKQQSAVSFWWIFLNPAVHGKLHKEEGTWNKIQILLIYVCMKENVCVVHLYIICIMTHRLLYGTLTEMARYIPLLTSIL